MFNFLSPVNPSTSIELDGMYLPSKIADKGRDETQVFERGGSISQMVVKNQKHQAAIGARYRELDLSGNSSILKDYYNHQLNLSYKKNLNDDLFWFSSFSFGSASDRPFKDPRDNTISVNYIQKFDSKWFGALNYSNNRAFLNNIPLPGIFYVQEMSRDKALIIGFPFIFWLRPLSDKWAIRYFSILPWTHRLKLFYKMGFISPYIGYEQSPQSFFRHDRDNDKDRVFWFERRVSMGMEGKLSKMVSMDLSSGWAFEREFFEARNFSKERSNLTKIQDAYFVSLNLRINL